MEALETQGEHGWEGSYEAHSLLVDRNHEILLAKHVDPRRPLPNTFVACFLAGARRDPTSDSPPKQESDTHSLIANFL